MTIVNKQRTFACKSCLKTQNGFEYSDRTCDAKAAAKVDNTQVWASNSQSCYARICDELAPPYV
jgi:hypothetical protein